MKKILLILFLFSSFSFSTFAQQSKIDSLQTVLQTASHDTTKINTLNSLSRELLIQGDYEKAMQHANDALTICDKLLSQKNLNYQSSIVNSKKATAYNNIGIIHKNKSDYDKALEFYFKSLKIREELGDKKGMAVSYYNIGPIHDNKGDYAKALEFYFKGLKIFEELGAQKEMAYSYGNIGLIHANKGDYAKALEFYFKGLKIEEEIGDKTGMATSYNSIGIIHKEKGDYDKALEFSFKSLKIKEEIGDKNGMAASYGNIGNIHDNKGDYVKALEFHFKSLKINEELGDKNGMAASYNNIGIILDNKGDYDKALEFYFKSLNIDQEIGNKNGMAVSYNNIGMLYTLQKKYNEAREHLNKGLALSKAIGNKENTRGAYDGLSQLDSTLGNFKGAYEYHKLYSLYNDSIFNEESSKQMHEFSAKYETEKKEQQIKLLEKDQEVSQAERKKQKIITFSVAGGLLLVILFAGFVFRSLRVTQKQKKELNIKNQKIENAYNLIEKQKKQIEEKHKEQTDSITYAKRLQQAILPPVELLRKHLPNGFVLYKPKDIVAGDFYWMEVIDDIIFLAAADCTGHGVPGAMVSVVCSNALNRTVKEFALRDTGKILDKVTDLVLETFEKSGEQIKDGMDISFLSYNKTSKQIQWSGANNPLWYIQNEQLIEVKADKQPIGKFDIRKPFTTHTIEYSENTTFYLFTDGLPDQFGGPKGKKFMYKRFETNLADICKLPMDEQQTILEKAFQDWKGALEQVDDVTVIGIRI